LPRYRGKGYDRSVAKSVVVPVLLFALCACAHHTTAPGGDEDEPIDRLTPSPEPLAHYRAAFAITYNGARIGYASERVRDRRLHRREELTVRRGDALVQLITVIDIDLDTSWRATAVKVERHVGATVTRGYARRAHGRWRVSFGDEPARTLDGSAVPLELLPLALARSHRRRFRGAVLLSGYGFAGARIRVAPRGKRQLETILSTAAGSARTLIDLADDGTIARVRGEVGAVRIGRAELGAPFSPPELVDTSSLAVSGTPPRFGPVELVVHDAPVKLPPALPGQRIRRGRDGWHVTLLAGDVNSAIREPAPAHPVTDPGLRKMATTLLREAGARTPSEQLVALTRATRTMIYNDLASPVSDARAALAIGRGDCTSHAVLLSSLAAAVGLPARLVTGYRLDGGRLIRHRWVIAKIGNRWIAVDPTYGEAPARPRLLGLAVHDSSAAQLAIVDDMAFAPLRNVTVSVRR